jgi:4-hydroxyphenylacetate 3-monooxygenase
MTMGARTGKEFLDGLRSRPREIWLANERVGDVTEHPDLKGAAHAVAGVFDRQHEFADDCLMTDDETGELVNVACAKLPSRASASWAVLRIT